MIRTGPFQFRDPALWFARVRLHADRLDLRGWHWHGRYLRTLPLRQILQVDAAGANGLVIWLTSGEIVRLRVRQARRWKTEIEARQAGLDSYTSGF